MPKTYATGELSLGIEQGGLHAAEALLLARYFMYTQVYMHPIRRVYDHHLKSFIAAALGQFSLDLEQHLRLTDNELMAEICAAARTPGSKGYVPARLIVEREHFQIVYERTPADVARNLDAAKVIADQLTSHFGKNSVHYSMYRERGRVFDFPVWTRSGVCSASTLSELLQNLPVTALDYIFVARDKKVEAERWLSENRERLLTPEAEQKP